MQGNVHTYSRVDSMKGFKILFSINLEVGESFVVTSEYPSALQFLQLIVNDDSAFAVRLLGVDVPIMRAKHLGNIIFATRDHSLRIQTTSASALLA